MGNFSLSMVWNNILICIVHRAGNSMMGGTLSVYFFSFIISESGTVPNTQRCSILFIERRNEWMNKWSDLSSWVWGRKGTCEVPASCFSAEQHGWLTWSHAWDLWLFHRSCCISGRRRLCPQGRCPCAGVGRLYPPPSVVLKNLCWWMGTSQQGAEENIWRLIGIEGEENGQSLCILLPPSGKPLTNTDVPSSPNNNKNR